MAPLNSARFRRRSTAEQAIWVLIYIFSYLVSPAATNDKAECKLTPTVVFQEFSSEQRCRDAKSKIEKTLHGRETR